MHIEVSAEVEPPKKKTLNELLMTLQAADDGLLEFDASIAIIGDELADKVDNIKLVMSKMEAEEKRLAGEIAELSAAKRTLANNRERLEAYVCFSMEANKFDKLPGKRWQLAFTQTENITIKPAFETPNADLYRKFPSITNRNYSWDKRAFNDAFKSGKHPELKNMADLKKTPGIKFTPRKGIE